MDEVCTARSLVMMIWHDEPFQVPRPRPTTAAESGATVLRVAVTSPPPVEVTVNGCVVAPLRVRVPVNDSVTVTNIGFHGVTYRNGDATGNTTTNATNFSNAAWTNARAGGVLTWSTQSQATNNLANAIRWGTTYNFRFDANIAPAAVNANVTLGMWKTGSPASAIGLAQVPGTPVPPACPADIDDDGDLGNGLNPDGGVDINDLLSFLAGFETGDIGVDLDDDGADPANPDGGVDINDLLFFLGHFETGC